MSGINSTLIKPITSRFLSVLQASFLSFVLSLILALGVVNSKVMAIEVITLQDAVSLTLQQHSELKSYAHSQKSAQSLVKQAGVGTPFTVKLEIEDALGTGSYSGISSMQTTLGISWLLESDVINSRVKVASEEVALIEYQRQAKALDVAAETANIFITLLTQQEQMKLAKLAKLQAEKSLKVITIRVNSAKANIIDQLRAKANLAKKALVVEDLHHEIEASIAQLAAQWQGSVNFSVAGTLLNIPSLESLEKVNQQMTQNPKIRAFSIEQRIAQSEIALAQVTAKPAWLVTTGIKRNEFVDDYALTASIAIPFGGENRNQSKVLALQAKQGQKQAQSQALQQRFSTQLLLLTHQLKHNRHVVEGLSEEIIPALELANDKAREAYQTGSYRYTDWYAVQQELLTAQFDLIQAYNSIQLFNIELERLTGASIANQ